MNAIAGSGESRAPQPKYAAMALVYRPKISCRTRITAVRAVRPATPINCVARGPVRNRSPIRAVHSFAVSKPGSVYLRTTAKVAACQAISAWKVVAARQRGFVGRSAVRLVRSATAEPALRTSPHARSIPIAVPAPVWPGFAARQRQFASTSKEFRSAAAG
jgi:hypothetical protein